MHYPGFLYLEYQYLNNRDVKGMECPDFHDHFHHSLYFSEDPKE